MPLTSLFLLLGAAATVAILHSILPDHWVPLAVVARTQKWSLLRVARVSALASAGHVFASLFLGGILALIGLQFQQQIDTQQGHIIGAILIITGLLFLVWGLVGHGPHGHSHGEGEHTHNHSDHANHATHDHDHSDHAHDHATHAHAEHADHNHDGHAHEHNAHEHAHAAHNHNTRTLKVAKEQSLVKRLSAIAIPFGVAASPDLTILPVVLAATAFGRFAVMGVLSIFTVVTIATFIALTMVATVIGYQIKGAWIEKNANTITSLVLIAIGVVAFIGF